MEGLRADPPRRAALRQVRRLAPHIRQGATGLRKSTRIGGECMTRPPRKRSNGEGSIYQRKDGRWTAAYFVPDHNGIRRRRYVYGDSPEAVEDKLVEIRKLVKSGVPVSPAGLNLETYLTEWIDQIAAPRVRPSTLESYRSAITKRIIPHLGRKKLGQLNARDVR